jgi:hypothetical protein
MIARDPGKKVLTVTRIMGIPITKMSGYTTAQAAKAVGVSKNTLLRWLYDGVLQEPTQTAKVGSIAWRMWSSGDIERAKKVKARMRPGPKSKKKT